MRRELLVHLVRQAFLLAARGLIAVAATGCESGLDDEQTYACHTDNDCLTGYQCDPVGGAYEYGRCVARSADLADAHMPDVIELAPGEVANLRAEYVLDRTIYWDWETRWTSNFATYRLHMSTSPAVEPHLDPGALVLDATTNPELGYQNLPTPGTESVSATVAWEVSPQTTYYGQVVLELTDGTLNVSNVVEVTTPTTDQEIVLVDEPPWAGTGYSLPSTLVESTSAPYTGLNHLEWVNPCTEPCWVHLRRQDLDAVLSVADLSASGAYWEFAIAIDGPHAWWSEARVSFGASSGETPNFHRGAFTMKGGGEYHVYRVPLELMTNAGVPLTTADVNNEVYDIGVGSTFDVGTTVRLDSLRLRWKQ